MSADRESRSFQRDGEASDPMADHKRRARWRLLGALIITGVVAAIAPLLLQEQARPLSQDLLIEIPSRHSLFSKIDSLKPAPTEASIEKSPETAKAEAPKAEAPKADIAKADIAKADKPKAEPAKAEMSKPEPPKIEPQKSEPKAEPKKSELKPIEPKKAETKTVEQKKSVEGGVFVQVGAYAKLESANAVKAKLTAGGHRVTIETIKLDDGSERHRVRIGPFETRELANQVRERAKSQGYEAMVVNP